MGRNVVGGVLKKLGRDMVYACGKKLGSLGALLALEFLLWWEMGRG